ncbi:hypothetical protein NDU88_006392 [Pleurodeles waltl]|uniref:Uncharacterized protein n=1 Tax=Pleurodeles waltl TaxID=8319 RepID=A0AAV7MCR1_PLEWA|nr:hypothetical protein NDU88_006392 [Pleurodeles waltl]
MSRLCCGGADTRSGRVAAIDLCYTCPAVPFRFRCFQVYSLGRARRSLGFGHTRCLTVNIRPYNGRHSVCRCPSSGTAAPCPTAQGPSWSRRCSRGRSRAPTPQFRPGGPQQDIRSESGMERAH